MEAIKQEPYEIVDAEFGDVLSCEAIPADAESETWYKRIGTGCNSGNPLSAEWRLRAAYANGAVAILVAHGWEIMQSRGFGGVLDKKPDGLVESPDWKGRFGNRRILATVASKIRSCGYFPAGQIVLLPDSEAEDVLASCGVRNRPCDIDREWAEKVERQWPEAWVGEGVAVRPDPELPSVEAKWWWARNISEETKAVADQNYFWLCDGRKVHKDAMTEDDWALIADPNDPDYDQMVKGKS